MSTRKLAIFTLFLLIFAAGGTAQAERLLPSDLTYIGAFKVPETDTFAGMAAIDSPSSMTYRPDGNAGSSVSGYPGSLILSNNDWVAEIAIPAPVRSSSLSALPTARQIQARNGITGSVDTGVTDRFGSVAYVGARAGQSTAKLYWSVFEYYNVQGDDYASLGSANVDFTSPNPAGIWHIGPAAGGNWDSAYHGNKYGEYIIPVDQAWADTYTGGRSILVGRYREAGAAGGSMGPVLAAVAPWQSGNPPGAGTNLSAVPLMYFNTISNHTSDTTWMNFKINGDPDYMYYSAGDHWHGGAWVTAGSKKAILIVGRHGTYDGKHPCPPAASGDGCHGAIGTNTPPYCYGTGGIECPDGIAVTNSKGYHTGPYKPRFLFIDPDDLAQVAQGKKSPGSVNAYAVYDPSADWPWKDSDRFNDVAGAAFDPASGLLYVVQGNANRPDGGSSTPWPVIHVYRINGAGGATTTQTTPNPPTQLQAN